MLEPHAFHRFLWSACTAVTLGKHTKPSASKHDRYLRAFLHGIDGPELDRTFQARVLLRDNVGVAPTDEESAAWRAFSVFPCPAGDDGAWDTWGKASHAWHKASRGSHTAKVA